MCVTHMFYTAWPDHGVPHNTMSLITFIQRVRRQHPVSLAKPLLVHCSAGVGRTGTFILLDLAMQQMVNEGTLCILGNLKKLRGERMKLVQTQVSYHALGLLVLTVHCYCKTFRAVIMCASFLVMVYAF